MSAITYAAILFGAILLAIIVTLLYIGSKTPLGREHDDGRGFQRYQDTDEWMHDL